jgi:toxin ParE1/3/4
VRVIWTPEAQQDRADIFDYIAADNPLAAVWMDELFGNAAARLTEHPKLGKPGKIAGTRELIPHKSYRLVYEIERKILWILTLVHTARRWPPVRNRVHKPQNWHFH